MAFKLLPINALGVARGRHRSDDVTVASFGKNRQFNTVFSIPRSVLRDAGLPDIPGATFDILVGEGSDAGSIAIIDGSRIRSQNVGNRKVPHRLSIRTSVLSSERFSSVAAQYTVSHGQIIIRLPNGFPLKPQFLQSAQLGAAA